MKKIRECFHRIAAAVFCLMMSIKTGLYLKKGQAAVPGSEKKKYVPEEAYRKIENIISSVFGLIRNRNFCYIKKVFFWLKGPGDRKDTILAGVPPVCNTRVIGL